MLPSAAAVTASSPSKRAGRHDDLAAMRFRQGNEIGVRQQRAGAEHHDGLAGFQHGPADPLEDRRGRAFDREVGEVRKCLQLHQRTLRCARHRAKPAPWPGRGRPHRRARAPACRRRAGARPRGRSRPGRLWRRGSLDNLPRGRHRRPRFLPVPSLRRFGSCGTASPPHPDTPPQRAGSPRPARQRGVPGRSRPRRPIRRATKEELT